MNICSHNIFSYLLLTLLSFALLILSGCSEINKLAGSGDYLQVDFTCTLSDGRLVETTLAQVAGNEDLTKSPIFALRNRYRPLKFTVAETTEKLRSKPFDPLQDKIGMAIAKHARELLVDKTTKLQLSSQVIENFPAKDRYMEMAMKYTMPRERKMPREEFNSRYNNVSPVIGATVEPKSDYPGVIKAVDEENVSIYFTVKEGVRITNQWGDARVSILDDTLLQARLDIKEGQLIQRIGGLPGRVTQADEEKFTIDFGQSFAGETLFCDVTAHIGKLDGQDGSVTNEKSEVAWIEDYNRGMELAREQKKFVILLLYADWCKYCHQMLDSVFPDQALDMYRDSFVWLKINSDKLTEYAEKYEQKSYPLMMILDADGQVSMKMDGYQHVTKVAHALNIIEAKRKEG